MDKPKQKILYFITKSNWGGAQKYVYDLATSPYILRDFQVGVYAGLSGNSNILFEKIEEFNATQSDAAASHITLGRLHLHNDFNIWKSFLNLSEFYNILKKENPDVIHVNSSKISIMMALVARAYNMVAAAGGHHKEGKKHYIKIIFTGHGWPHSEVHRPLLWRLVTQVFMILTAILSHRTICVSYATRDALLNNIALNIIFKKYLNKKTRIIHNGVNQNSRIILPKLRETIDSPHYGKINLVSIGDYHPNKGHDTVIRYMNKLDNMHYHIIGNGEWRAHLENLVSEHKLHNKVHLIHIPENAAHVLNRYDIYLQPSRKEGFSIAIPEALQAGLPVIARDVGGAKELIKNNLKENEKQTALTLYKDDHELIDILKNWKVESLEAYHEWIDDRFSIENMIKETKALYEN